MREGMGFMLSYRLERHAVCISPGFPSIWRPTSVCLNQQLEDTTLDLDQLIRTLLGCGLAFVAALCYMRLIHPLRSLLPQH
jgi:hypothetical protein